jgi:thioredoxin 1
LFSNITSPLNAGQVSAAKSEELVKHLDDTNFEKTVKESKVPVLVDFYATWCDPCKRMSPRLEELAKEYDGKLLVVKVDVDRCPKMKAKYGISRLPTLYLLKPGGETLKSSTGEKSLDGLRDFVKDAVKQ